MVGAYFGAEMARAEREGRVCAVPVDARHPVHTVWDLGRAVNNPIWCFQVIGGQLRIVDFHIPESEDIEEWVRWLNDRGYRGNDYVPHDIVVTEWGSRRTRFETLVLLGRKPVRIAKVAWPTACRPGGWRSMPRSSTRIGPSAGIDGLKAYRREWDDELKTFRENPVKDWAEHIGSAWRYLGLAWREVQPVIEKPKPRPIPPGYIMLPGPPEPRRGDRIRLWSSAGLSSAKAMKISYLPVHLRPRLEYRTAQRTSGSSVRRREMRIIGYERVSTARQGASGLGHRGAAAGDRRLRRAAAAPR